MQILLLIAVLNSSTTNGYLTVNTDKPGVNVYLDGELIGATPILNFSVKSGEYSISLYDTKTIENEYWNLRKAGLLQKMLSFWQLIRIDAATQRVRVNPNRTTKISFYTSRINCAPTLAKFIFGGTIIGIFGLGFLTGILIAK